MCISISKSAVLLFLVPWNPVGVYDLLEDCSELVCRYLRRDLHVLGKKNKMQLVNILT